MSEMSQGPGYWQASDGLWYPPESHPDHQAQQAQPPAAVSAAGAAGLGNQLAAGAFNRGTVDYPIRLDVSTDNKVARWRVFVQWILAIPHFIIMYFLGIASYAVAIINWFAILFTGKAPEGLYNFQVMVLRYGVRTYGYAGLLTEEFPAFDFESTPADTSGYPLQLSADPNPSDRNRVTVFFRLFMVIPHLFALTIVSIAAAFVYLIAWFAILFTGRFPVGMRNFTISFSRWYVRVMGYYVLITDEYPPFSLD